MNDEGTQGVRYPSVHDRGQRVQYPSVNDSEASSQIQVKICEDVMYLVSEGMLFHLSCGLHFPESQVWIIGDLKAVIFESKGQALALHC